MTATQVLLAFREVACDERAATMPKYVNAVPGGYGEGDQFSWLLDATAAEDCWSVF